MKYGIVFLLGVICVLPVFGEDNLPSSIQVSTAVETPTSNIDWLKKSFEKSSSGDSIIGVYSKEKAVAAKKEAARASEQTAGQQPTPAPAAVPPAQAAETALPGQPAPVPVSQPSAPRSVSSSTLEMPLNMGGQTQTVQTTVSPVKKTLSPAAAQRVAAAKEQHEKAVAKAQAQEIAADKPAQPVKETDLEKSIEKDNALLPTSSVKELEGDKDADLSSEEVAADAELEYAVKMLEKSKAKAESTERPIPPSAAQNRPSKVPAPHKKFDPNAFRPGVEWIASKSNHFDIYTQKRTSGIPSSNMSMTFETAYQTLRRFIPWMMSGRVRVFVYQDHQSYLRHEPNAKAWTRALAYPTRGEIVVYDEPGKQRELQEVFTHELTHIFTQQFFDSHKTGKIMTPTWLDEGLAVFMEDQTSGSKGGPWANDLKTLNVQRDPSEVPPTVAANTNSMFGSSFGNRLGLKKKGKPVYLVPFEAFMSEGSLPSAEANNKVQDWYFQAYAMVRFLLNPAGGSSPSNRMQFEQFTRLMAQGEAKRDPSSGFLVKDAKGRTVYEPYSVEKALGRAYRYGTIENFEDNFWRWMEKN